MKLDMDYAKQDHPLSPAGGAPKTGLLAGLTALTILGSVGLFSVLPAGAMAYSGFGWVDISANVGAQADSGGLTCPVAASFAMGLKPICAMVLE